MIKRGMLVLLFLIVFALSVDAMTVELETPDNGDIILDSEEMVSPMCLVTVGANENLSNVTLYFKNNITGGDDAIEWHADQVFDDIDTSEGYSYFSTTLGFESDHMVNATYTWNWLAVSNDSVETWAPDNYTFIITSTEAAPAVNHAPELLSNIPDMVWPEDTINNSLSLNTYFNDSDGQTMTFSTVESPSGMSVSFNSGVVTFTPNANWTGNTSVMFSASDGTNTTNSNPVSLTITAVNDAPYLSSAIPNKTWSKDATAQIDLDEYFFDVDDSSLNYSYTFTSSSPFNINVTIESDGDAVFTPESSWTGTETLTFTAYDNVSLSATSNEIVLTVEAANATNATNNPPSIDTYSPLSDPTISVGESQTFSITKSDPDGDSMNVTWYVDNVVQEGKTGNSLVYTASTVGSFTVKVAVSDGKLSDLNTWVLTVESAGVTTNKTTAPPGEEEVGNKTLACGDGVCAEGEDQFSCCKDCGCPEDYTCYEPTGKCRKEEKAGNMILLIVIAALFLGGAGAGVYFYKKKQEKEIFGDLANTPFKLPPKEEKVEVKKEELQKPAEAVVKKVEEKPKTDVVEKPLKTAKSSSQVLLKNYIIQNLKKGKTWEQLKAELRSVGWTDEQIDEAYTAAQLEEAFS